MSTLLRRTAAAVMMIGSGLLTGAGSPAAQEGFTGTWITWWDAGGVMSPCSRMDVVAENENTLDGMWAAPGFNGLLHGTVQQTRAGLRWEGEWRDTEGGSGSFRFVRGAPGMLGDHFEGVYTVADEDEEMMWNGVRLVEGDIPDAPCVFAG
jgi:hypothetical protein